MACARRLLAPVAPPRDGRYFTCLVAGLAFVTYTASRSGAPTGDSLQTALAVERGGLATLFIPHRLLIQPLAWVFLQGWAALGWQGGALLPLQMFSAVGGAASVALLYAIGRRLTGSSGAALLAATGFAVSTVAWAFSTDAEPVMTPLALALLPIWGVLAAGPAPSRRQVALLGLATGLAILTYHVSALLIPVVVVGLGLAEGQTRSVRWRRVGLFLVVVLAIIIPSYLLALATVFGVHDWQTLLGWQLYGGLRGGSASYGQLKWASLPYGAYGLVRSLAWYPPLRFDQSTAAYLAASTWGERAAFAVYVAVSLVAVAAPLVALAVARHRLRISRHGGAMLAVWGLLNLAFAAWWVPGDMQFWVPVVAAWWLLVGVLLATHRAAGAGAMPSRRWRVRLAPWSTAVAGVFVVALVNGLGFVAPSVRLDQNPRHALAFSARTLAAPDDLVITSGLDPFRFYLVYFGPRHIIDVFGELTLGREQGASNQEVLARIDRDVNAARAAGRRVFIVDLAAAGALGRPADAAGQAAFEAIRRQQMWPIWLAADDTAQLAVAYLDHLPTQRAWQGDGQTILEVVSVADAAGP